MQPIWSPDGKKLAFTGDGFTGIYVRNADGTGPIKELSADYSGYKPMWTSDSRAIVVRTRRGIVGQSISLIDVETGEVRELARWVAHPGQPERNIHRDIVVEIGAEEQLLSNDFCVNCTKVSVPELLGAGQRWITILRTMLLPDADSLTK